MHPLKYEEKIESVIFVLLNCEIGKGRNEWCLGLLLTSFSKFCPEKRVAWHEAFQAQSVPSIHKSLYEYSQIAADNSSNVIIGARADRQTSCTLHQGPCSYVLPVGLIHWAAFNGLGYFY